MSTLPEGLAGPTGMWQAVSFDDAGSKGSLWRLGAEQLADGTWASYRDEGAEVEASARALSVRIEAFGRSSAVTQTLDNAKHVYLTRPSFAVAPGQTFTVQADVAATRSSPRSGDYRDGFAVLGLVDPVTGFVADLVTTGEQVLPVLERLGDEGFTWCIDAPLAPIVVRPGEPNRFRIEIEVRERPTVSYWVDDVLVCRQHEVPVPIRALHISAGILTLQPVRDGVSRSVGGQGLHGRWGDVELRWGTTP